MTIPLLQITLRFSVALPGPLFALPFGSIRMDGGAKNRWNGGKTLPTTRRMTAAVFLDAELLVAEDRMTLGLGIPSLFSLLSTVRTAILSYVKQYRLFLSECILSFRQQRYLFCMTQP